MFTLVGNIQDANCYSKDFENEILGVTGTDDSGGLYDFGSSFSDWDAYDTPTVQFSPGFSALDDIYRDIESLLTPPCRNDPNVNFDEPKKEDQSAVPLPLPGIIQPRNRPFYGTDFGPQPRHRLSTEDILRLAGENFVQTSSHPFGMTLPFVGLSPSEVRDVVLVQKLLFVAQKCGQKQYDQARTFLDQCDISSSNNGNQMERTVYYFSKALREKIDRETGLVFCDDSLKKQAMQVEENYLKARPVILAFYQEIPLYQITLYAGMQVITEQVAGARRVHVIDLDIRSGLHTSVLMQALADRLECPIELLKITAVTTKLKWTVEDTGNRLREFAKSINLPFLFNIVMVPDLLELNKELFEIDPKEMVAVNALYTLQTMICRPNELESLMKVVKSINPQVMVVSEIEGKLNSPVFVNRFIEALFYYGAFFDCIEDITSRDSQLRIQLESIYLGYGIRNVIVAEGGVRTIRHVNLDTWRTFFSRFDMKEEELSTSLLLQANLVAKTYECWKSCSIYKDEKSLIVGWKGMPLMQVSAWTFEKNDLSTDND